jgi:hypothetical protein
MRNELTVKTPEGLAAVAHHPIAGTIGGVLFAAVCGGIGMATASPAVAALMGLLGLCIGAPLGAVVADSAAPSRV